MKKELLFYNQIEFDSIRELFHTLGYEMISLGFILDDIKNTYSLYQNGVYVIDVSILGSKYNVDAIQSIGENIFRILSNEEIIYICDSRYIDQFKYELRYCFEDFIDIKEKYSI